MRGTPSALGSGEPVAPDALMHSNGAVVGFCDPGCRDKFKRAVEHFAATQDRSAKNG